MEILPVLLEKEQFEKLFPIEICNLIEEMDNRIYAAVDEEVIKAAAVLTASESVANGYMINYITMCGDENLDTFNSLMDYVEDECQKAGAKILCCRMFMEEDCESVRPFLFSRDYTDISKDGIYMSYRVADILSTVFGSKKETMKSLMKNVKCYNELSKSEIAVFADKMKKSDENMNFKLPDLVFGRFYLSGGEIVGYMDIRETKPGVLYLSDTYIDSGEKTKYALPAMIASAMIAFEALMSADSCFEMQIFNKNLLNGIKAIYGDAPLELDILEMAKML